MSLPVTIASPPSRASAPASYVVDMDYFLGTVLPDFAAQINALNASDWFGTQSGYHDTTAGRVLTAGAYGWGQVGNIQSDALLDDIVSSGVHQFGSSDPDTPLSSGGAVLVVRYSASWLSQIVFDPNSPDMFLRRSQDNGSTWTAWDRIFNSGNATGSGRIVEAGANANGTYTRFIDGTQICRKYEAITTTTTASGAVFSTGGGSIADWTFPAAFSAAPEGCSFTARGTTTWGSGGGTVTTTTMPRLIISGAALTAESVDTWSMAIGTWA